MKNKNIILLVVIILLLLTGSYYFLGNKNNGVETANQNTTTETSTTTTKTESTQTYPSNYVKIGQKTLINGLYVTPVKVTYDGRCPIDIKCVQNGTVDIGVLLEEGSVTQDVIITLNRPLLFVGKIGNKTITLIGVSPEKTSTRTLKSSDYRFTFSVK